MLSREGPGENSRGHLEELLGGEMEEAGNCSKDSGKSINLGKGARGLREMMVGHVKK